jgi:hypothetical protein
MNALAIKLTTHFLARKHFARIPLGYHCEEIDHGVARSSARTASAMSWLMCASARLWAATSAS